MSTSGLIPTIVIAGTHSGVGKTTLTVAVIAAFRARGLVVQPFKCGPDYIDPGYLSAAAGRACRNLDAWMLGRVGIRDCFQRACRGADIAVVEGVMGLYDGTDFNSNDGSAAHVAALLDASVVLVVDIGGAARSVAATVLGFRDFEPAIRLSGVILNRAGSEAHASGCSEAIRGSSGLPVLGWMPRDAEVHLPERHLGLRGAAENRELPGIIARLAGLAERHFKLGAMLDLCRGHGLPCSAHPSRPADLEPGERRPVLAVARDEAFCFYYPDNLECLEDAGVDIRYFSPIGGEAPSIEADGVYLGGGYPELHAAALSSNQALRQRLRELHAEGAPILGECGGFMTLCEAIVDLEGRNWPMVGLVPGCARMTKNLSGLGYREVLAEKDNLLVTRGAMLRGHEFHHSIWELDATQRARVSPAWQVRDTRGRSQEQASGHVEGNLLASYLHVYFSQQPQLLERLVSLLKEHASRKAGA